eukprot:TRINITY_DN17371_c0_g1_i2.p3 TRINITY_DN17371_c0_g1~~TRINITY_DN17371_c0_g1_i2.p3  ORF type:complete len:119 (+),score=16.84 TRINITY_DN17371_c0_g1_i2:531-887(+)
MRGLSIASLLFTLHIAGMLLFTLLLYGLLARHYGTEALWDALATSTRGDHDEYEALQRATVDDVILPTIVTDEDVILPAEVPRPETEMKKYTLEDSDDEVGLPVSSRRPHRANGTRNH